MERTGSLCAGTAEDEYDSIGGVIHHSFFSVMVFNSLEFEGFRIGYRWQSEAFITIEPHYYMRMMRRMRTWIQTKRGIDVTASQR